MSDTQVSRRDLLMVYVILSDEPDSVLAFMLVVLGEPADKGQTEQLVSMIAQGLKEHPILQAIYCPKHKMLAVTGVNDLDAEVNFMVEEHNGQEIWRH